MKNKYIILITALTLASMLLLEGCNKKPGDNVNVKSGQVALEENKQDNEANKKVEETEYANIDKIVEPGYEAVEQYLDEEYANKSFQGVALVAKGDEIKFAKAYGYADEDEKRENTLTTRFAIASNTKQFTATAIMQLVEKKKINLDDTIDKYFPEYKYGSQITVKDLLQMRSGIPDYLNEVEIFMKDEEASKIVKDYENSNYKDKYVEDARWSSDLILKNLYLTELQFEPNTAYDYCNTNYYLLGLIIEQVTGISYEKYIEENIFKPANMVTSSMVAEDTDAKGHGSAESGVIVANPKFTYAAGDIHANIFDVFRWNRMLHKGDIISKESYNAMITPVDGYGYGLFVNEGIIRHSGVIDGFNSNTQYDTINDVTIIVMENSDSTMQLLDAKYDTSIINELIPR